jgi:hypothetical protein
VGGNLRPILLKKIRKTKFSLDLIFSKKTLNTYPEGDETVCAESLDILFLPPASKWTKLVTGADIFSLTQKLVFYNIIGKSGSLGGW